MGKPKGFRRRCARFTLDRYDRCWHGEVLIWQERLLVNLMSSSTKTPEKEIRILIADDHPVVREGLVAILALEDDLKVVGQAHNGEEACAPYAGGTQASRGGVTG